MTALAPTVQAFFTQRLVQERNASPHTIAAYRDTIKLLLHFAAARNGREPSTLDLADLDAEMIAAFLDHSITSRPNATTTPVPGTRGWRRSTRSTDTPRSDTPSTRRTSSASYRSRRNAPTGRS